MKTFNSCPQFHTYPKWKRKEGAKFLRMRTPFKIKKQNTPNQPDSLNCGPLHALLIAHLSNLQQHSDQLFSETSIICT